MGIDILKLDESSILSTLGSGDWAIALPNNYPDITVTAEWRERLSDEVACRFVRWVLDGQFVEITHDYDPPWDHSGRARHYKCDSQLLLTRHATLQEWLEQAYTGNSQASFVSGMGLLWNTYGDEIAEYIDQRVADLLKIQLQFALGCADDDEIWMDIWDEVTWVQSALSHTLLLQIGPMPTHFAWQRFERIVRAQLDQERQLSAERAARYHAMQELTREFWNMHFADVNDLHLQRPQFKGLRLDARLREILLDTDPDIVEAIAEVGLPGYFSNSVRDEIKQMARHSLTE